MCLRRATGETPNLYNLSARLLIFDTYIPPITTTHTLKFRSCLSDTFLIVFFLFGKRVYFQNISPRTNLKCMIYNFFYYISDTSRKKLNIHIGEMCF